LFWLVEMHVFAWFCSLAQLSYLSAPRCILSGSALKERGQTWQQVGAAAAQSLLTHLAQRRSCSDEFLTDQLVIFMALAAGTSRVRCGPLSLHTRTAIHFAQHITGARLVSGAVFDCIFSVC
jgi:RNA 3'-terminal phosphate cyclase